MGDDTLIEEAEARAGVSVGFLQALLADQSRRIGELEGALKPFADLADIAPIMTGRGENTVAANPRDSDPFHWGQRISWGMLRRARAALKAEEGNKAP